MYLHFSNDGSFNWESQGAEDSFGVMSCCLCLTFQKYFMNSHNRGPHFPSSELAPGSAVTSGDNLASARMAVGVLPHISQPPAFQATQLVMTMKSYRGTSIKTALPRMWDCDTLTLAIRGWHRSIRHLCQKAPVSKRHLLWEDGFLQRRCLIKGQSFAEIRARCWSSRGKIGTGQLWLGE